MTSHQDALIRPLRTEDVSVASALACQVFDEMVAPDLSPEGIEEFHRYANALSERLGKDHRMFVAEWDEDLVGMMEVRERRHISMLFVDSRFRGQGIGGRLLRRALDECLSCPDPPARVTVNSSVGAVGFYQRLGFAVGGPEQESNGIRFVPMTFDVTETSAN